MSEQRCEKIKQAVVDMYEECEVSSYPVDPFYLAEKLRYILRPYSTLSESKRRKAFRQSKDAYSRYEQNRKTGVYRFVIYYNDFKRNKMRIRWSLLHEIGHCYLEHHFHKPLSKKVEEAEANLFAKYALAPPPAVHALHIRSPLELARRFQASKEASGYSFEYYLSWRKYKRHHPVYSENEIRLLEMFNLLSA